MRKIDRFDGDNKFLSNFPPAQVVFDGMYFESVEHAYQAAKTFSIECRERLAMTESLWGPFKISDFTAAEAKRYGRKLPLRPDWEIVKIPVMLELLRKKFADPYLRSLLHSTGDAELIEGNWWGDTFWGVCNGVGENHLGKLLMQVREEIRSESKRR